MKSKKIYICQENLYEEVEGAPCIILKRKSGSSNQYVEIEFLFSNKTYLCFKKDLKKATPAMEAALTKAQNIYTKSKELGDVIQELL